MLLEIVYNQFQVGDPPYHKLIQKTSPVTFHMKNQLDTTVTKTDAEHYRLANLDNWKIPKDKKGRPVFKVKDDILWQTNSSNDEFSGQQ